MATEGQIRANRLNAQKSTGPRTAEGKEKASQNAVRHGLLAREAVIAGEDPEEFEVYRERMLEELAPAGQVEAMLAERVVGLSWRLRRAERLQNVAFAALDDGAPTPLLAARLEEWKQIKGSEWDRGISGVVDENPALGRVVVEDFAEARVLDRLLMYERRIESSLYRTMAQLRNERQARAAAAAPEEISRSEGCLQAGHESVTPAKLASFGAKVVPESQMQETGFGGPEPPADVARGTGILPVAGNHGQDAHATETLAGVTANPPAGGLDCHSDIPSFHRSSPVPDVPAEEQSCERNPISEAVCGCRRDVSSELCKTNPISPGLTEALRGDEQESALFTHKEAAYGGETSLTWRVLLRSIRTLVVLVGRAASAGAAHGA
jgi:hypothetical protein